MYVCLNWFVFNQAAVPQRIEDKHTPLGSIYSLAANDAGTVVAVGSSDKVCTFENIREALSK
jgi:hypothetical protein